MPDKKMTHSRFPLYGLFAHQAAKHIGYSEDDSQTTFCSAKL
jgi:hypothetical protein